MNPFLKSLVSLLLNVFVGGMTWQEAIRIWLEGQIAVIGSRESVVLMLSSIANGEGTTASNEVDEQCSLCQAANVERFGDGKILDFLKTIDWKTLAAYILEIIALIPKSEPAPDTGPVE